MADRASRNKHLTLTQLAALGQDSTDVIAAMRDGKTTVQEGIAGMYELGGLPMPAQTRVAAVRPGHVSPRQEADFCAAFAAVREQVRTGQLAFLDARNGMRRLAKKPPLSAVAKTPAP